MELKAYAGRAMPEKTARKGIRNRVLVIYTVKCAEFVARRDRAQRGRHAMWS